MNKLLQKILISTTMVLVLTSISCNREDPSVVNNTPSVKSLSPIAVYTLAIPEPSSVAYNVKRNSLYIVSDAQSDVYEVDFTGVVKSIIPTTSSDLEGITFSKNYDTLYVVEETNRLVVSYLTNGTRLSSFTVNVATNPGNALEGVFKDTVTNHLIVLNEKLPCMLLEFNNTTEVRRKEINYSTDISDIFFEYSTNNFWIVSHESRKIMKLTVDFNLISEWSIPASQAEGITIIQDKIYIVSDNENKMYVFSKPN